MKTENKNHMNSAIFISIVSIIVNLALSLLKLIAGIVGHSQALIADAVHSASDVFSTFIVVASLKISGKEADQNHEYGHQKFESLASLVLSLALAVTGIEIGYTGLRSILTGSYLTAALPSMITAVAAAVSILTKEAMYQVTMRYAKKNKSNALKADAWHHRSDALSSIGSLAGVLFARFGFPIMDPIASLVIFVFIMKTAVEIFLEAARQLTDSSCDKEIEKEIDKTVRLVPEVQNVDLLKTRLFGAGYYVDIEISLDGEMSLNKSHQIAEQVHDRIEREFPDVCHCMVHVNAAA